MDPTPTSSEHHKTAEKSLQGLHDGPGLLEVVVEEHLYGEVGLFQVLGQGHCVRVLPAVPVAIFGRLLFQPKLGQLPGDLVRALQFL